MDILVFAVSAATNLFSEKVGKNGRDGRGQTLYRHDRRYELPGAATSALEWYIRESFSEPGPEGGWPIGLGTEEEETIYMDHRKGVVERALGQDSLNLSGNGI